MEQGDTILHTSTILYHVHEGYGEGGRRGYPHIPNTSITASPRYHPPNTSTPRGRIGRGNIWGAEEEWWRSHLLHLLHHMHHIPHILHPQYPHSKRGRGGEGMCTWRGWSTDIRGWIPSPHPPLHHTIIRRMCTWRGRDPGIQGERSHLLHLLIPSHILRLQDPTTPPYHHPEDGVLEVHLQRRGWRWTRGDVPSTSLHRQGWIPSPHPPLLHTILNTPTPREREKRRCVHGEGGIQGSKGRSHLLHLLHHIPYPPSPRYHP